MKNSAKTSDPSKFKKLVMGVAVLGIVSVGSVATVSAFSSSATSNVTVTAGSIDLKVGGADTFPISLSEINKPGTTVTKTVTVSNPGTLPLKYTATTSAIAANTLAPVIDVVVTPQGGTALASKKLNALTLPETTIAAGGSQTLTMVFTWPDRTSVLDNPLMGAKGDAVITFNAVQG